MKKMSNKLSKKYKLELLDYMFEYEKVLKSNINAYDYNNPNFIKFVEENKTFVVSMCKSNINKRDMTIIPIF